MPDNERCYLLRLDMISLLCIKSNQINSTRNYQNNQCETIKLLLDRTIEQYYEHYYEHHYEHYYEHYDEHYYEHYYEHWNIIIIEHYYHALCHGSKHQS